jgi:hypothetical protein
MRGHFFGHKYKDRLFTGFPAAFLTVTDSHSHNVGLFMQVSAAPFADFYVIFHQFASKRLLLITGYVGSQYKVPNL